MPLSEKPLNDPAYYGGGMSFGNTAGNVGQQGTNSGNVAVGHQWNVGYHGRRGGFHLLYMQIYCNKYEDLYYLN